MLTSLRRKFIAIAMFSMALVLTVIITGINAANYINVCRIADERIALIAANGGTFPQLTAPPYGHAPQDKDHGISGEAAFDTRYFTVTLLPDGTFAGVDTGKIASASSEDAAAYAMAVKNRHKVRGFIDRYRYQAVETSTASGEAAVMYIFMNSERELSTFFAFLLASAGISLAGLAVVFVLVVFFSKRAVKPVAESYEKQKRFITDASHEIKTPLTIIDANTEVIEMTAGESQWTRSTRKQIRRLSSLTEKLVFLTRMEEASGRPEFVYFDLSDAVLDTAAPFAAVAESTGKNLTLQVEPDITIKGDEATLRQLVSLLLDNAMKYSTDHSTIRLSLRTSGKNRVLTVWNQTPPIAAGRHDELFERFYREDASRSTQNGGFGIGLSVARAIVLSHRGKISARSADGTSLEFVVTLTTSTPDKR